MPQEAGVEALAAARSQLRHAHRQDLPVARRVRGAPGARAGQAQQVALALGPAQLDRGGHEVAVAEPVAARPQERARRAQRYTRLHL